MITHTEIFMDLPENIYTCEVCKNRSIHKKEIEKCEAYCKKQADCAHAELYSYEIICDYDVVSYIQARCKLCGKFLEATMPDLLTDKQATQLIKILDLKLQ